MKMTQTYCLYGIKENTAAGLLHRTLFGVSGCTCLSFSLKAKMQESITKIRQLFKLCIRAVCHKQEGIKFIMELSLLLGQTQTV